MKQPWRLEIKVKSKSRYRYFETKKAARVALVNAVEKYLASLKSRSPDHLTVRPLKRTYPSRVPLDLRNDHLPFLGAFILALFLAGLLTAIQDIT